MSSAVMAPGKAKSKKLEVVWNEEAERDGRASHCVSEYVRNTYSHVGGTNLAQRQHQGE